MSYLHTCCFMCTLNVFQTYIKNFNRKLFPGICWKKSKQQKKSLLFFSSACIIISMFDLHTVHLKSFCRFMCPLNVFQTNIKNFNWKLFPGICWKNGNVQTAKKCIKKMSSASIIISMFDLHTVHLKCFCSFMCPLNVFQIIHQKL